MSVNRRVMVPAGSSGTRALLSRHRRCRRISSIVADTAGDQLRYSPRPTSPRAMMMRWVWLGAFLIFRALTARGEGPAGEAVGEAPVAGGRNASGAPGAP